MIRLYLKSRKYMRQSDFQETVYKMVSAWDTTNLCLVEILTDYGADILQITEG